MGQNRPDATVVIVTKDRHEELSRALASVATQRGLSFEVVIIDDCSADAIDAVVSRSFPEARLIRASHSSGHVVLRNVAARLARGAAIVSIDDDAVFTKPNSLAQALADLDHPTVGAVAMPVVFDELNGSRVEIEPATGEAVEVTSSFAGTAYAVRTDLFLTLGGYRPQLIRQGEECDFCIRLLQHGYVTRMGRSAPVHHRESPHRDPRRIARLAARNAVLFAWHNVPLPYLLVHLLGASLNTLRRGGRDGRLADALRGVGQAYRLVLTREERAPVSRAVYRLDRRLRKRVRLPLTEVELRLRR